PMSPSASSDPPDDSASSLERRLSDLAPDGVCPAASVTRHPGGLLHHRFTLTRPKPGGLLSVALARGLPRVGVTHHPCSVEPGRSSAVAGRDRLVTCPQATHSTCSTQSRVIRSRKSGPFGGRTRRSSSICPIGHVGSCSYDGWVKILLPPSEGKTPAQNGPALDLDGLSAPELRSQRERVLAALKKVSTRSDALERLGVGASLAQDVERNTVLDTIACAPALLTYSGVLYEAMRASALVAAADDDEVLRGRLHDVLVFSALFGRVRGLDASPLCTAGVATGCRSRNFPWARPGPTARVVTMGAVTLADGNRRVAVHWAKFDRGQFAGRLLAYERPIPESTDELVARAQEF